jgi:hypothetical protein
MLRKGLLGDGFNMFEELEKCLFSDVVNALSSSRS